MSKRLYLTNLQRMNLARNLKLLRLAYRRRLSDVADDLKISQSSVWAYEKCGRMTEERFTMLSKYYMVSKELLVGDWEPIRKTLWLG